MPKTKYASEEERKRARNEASARSRLKKKAAKAGLTVEQYLARNKSSKTNTDIAKRMVQETKEARQANTQDKPVNMDRVADMSRLSADGFKRNPYHEQWCSKWYPANGDVFSVRVLPAGANKARVRYECRDPRFEKPAYNMSKMLDLPEAVEVYKDKCSKVQRKVDRINGSE